MVELCTNRYLKNAKLQIGKRGQKTELTGRSALRWRCSGLDCSAIVEDEEEEEGGGGGGGRGKDEEEERGGGGERGGGVGEEEEE
jgi:hypothetical protein